MTNNFLEFKKYILDKFKGINEEDVNIALDNIDDLLNKNILNKSKEVFFEIDVSLEKGKFLEEIIVKASKKALIDNLKNDNYTRTKNCKNAFENYYGNIVENFIPDFVNNFNFSDYVDKFGPIITDIMNNTEIYANKDSLKYHKPICLYAPKENNRIVFASKEEAESKGYTKCPMCCVEKPLYIGNNTNKSYHLPTCQYAPKNPQKRVEFFSKEEVLKSGFKYCTSCGSKIDK